MTSSHDLPAAADGTTSPDPGPARQRGRRAAMLLAAAAPLAAALAAAPLASASPAAPSTAAHASAMIVRPDCLSHFGAHQVPKIPECLGD